MNTPARQTKTPARMMLPWNGVISLAVNSPRYHGSVSVPTTAHHPSTIAMPSPTPRYRTDSPNVRFPTPHSIPKNAQ